MALTLAQSALQSNDPVRRGVIETFVQQSTVLDRLPLMPITGNSYKYNEEGTLPGVEFRAINGSYAESTGTVNQKTEGLVILGGEADVDTFLRQTRGDAVGDLMAEQTRIKVKSLAYKFQDAFVNGDVAVDANGFDGLKKRLTGAQVIAAAVNGLPVLGADDPARQTFLDQLDALIAAVPGLNGGNGALYTNNLIQAKLLSSFRRLNVYTENVQRLPQGLSGVGADQAVVPTYRGIPIIDIGTKADGTLIIPQTETQGASVVASSIYAVKFGQDAADRGVTGMTNGGVQVKPLGELQSKPAFRVRIEAFVGMGLFGGKAAARLAGVLNA